MAGISDEDIRRVREASDLVTIAGEHVQLRQRGRDFWGCCPFHQEKSPSFKIDPTTQLWHCFGCGEGGDVFSYVMKLNDMGFGEAVRELARRAGIQIAEDPAAHKAKGQKARLKEVCAAAAEFFHMQLMRTRGAEVDEARQYLAGRQLGGAVPKEWQLGFAPGRQTLVRHLASLGFSNKEMIDANVAMPGKNGGPLRDRFFNRIMFPIRDADGDVIAFGGRVVGKGEPKYLNSQETPVFHKSEVLYGLDKAKSTMASTGVAIIVEGYTDVIVLHQAGVNNAVATLGTALTIQHIRLISRHAKRRIVYLFDGDEAGQRAADRAAQFIDESMLPEAGRSKIDLYAVTLPDNLDPADFVQQRGADALHELLDDAVPLLRYAIDRKLAGRNLVDYAERSRALMDALGVLAPIKKSIIAQDYAGYIASRLNMEERTVADKLASMPAPRPPQEPVLANDAEEPEDAAAYAPAPVMLTPAERDRLRIERGFLSVCARNPQLGLAHADVIAATLWHRRKHEAIALALMDCLAAQENPLAADVLRFVDAACPGAMAELTGASDYNDVEPEKLAAFLSEELAMRDLEEAILGLNAQLKGDAGMSEEDRELSYASVVAMQNQLVDMRRAHKPLGLE